MWKGLGESGGDWHLALGAGSPDAPLRAVPGQAMGRLGE